MDFWFGTTGCRRFGKAVLPYGPRAAGAHVDTAEKEMDLWVATRGHQLSGTLRNLKRDLTKTYPDDGSIKAPGVAAVAFEDGVEDDEGEE